MNIVASPTGIAALRAYQQVKQHGEPTPSRSELQTQLGTESDISTANTPDSPAPVSLLSSEEQLQQQRELERSWGLMSAILGTQFDEYA